MRHFGLIGYPLGHSFSKQFFSEKFSQEGIEAEYLNFELSHIEQFPEILQEDPCLQGLNVTIPYKQVIIPFLNELSSEAKSIGAVNVIRIGKKNGEKWLTGFNSDVIGFRNSLVPLLKPWHTQALVLGTGGASKAICHVLDELNIKWLRVSRHPSKDMLGYEDLHKEILQEMPLIVNCTPLGTFPHTDTCPKLPYEALTSRNLLYDLVYNPEKTLFLKKGEAQGASIKNGLQMLYLQAIASWKFWTEY